MSATDYTEVLYQLRLGRKAIARVFEGVDVLITPTLAQLPVSIEAALESPRFDVTQMLIRNPAPFAYAHGRDRSPDVREDVTAVG